MIEISLIMRAGSYHARTAAGGEFWPYSSGHVIVAYEGRGFSPEGQYLSFGYNSRAPKEQALSCDPPDLGISAGVRHREGGEELLLARVRIILIPVVNLIKLSAKAV